MLPYLYEFHTYSSNNHHLFRLNPIPTVPEFLSAPAHVDISIKSAIYRLPPSRLCRLTQNGWPRSPLGHTHRPHRSQQISLQQDSSTSARRRILTGYYVLCAIWNLITGNRMIMHFCSIVAVHPSVYEPWNAT